jgi:hypothetical protein
MALKAAGTPADTGVNNDSVGGGNMKFIVVQIPATREDYNSVTNVYETVDLTKEKVLPIGLRDALLVEASTANAAIEAAGTQPGRFAAFKASEATLGLTVA